MVELARIVSQEFALVGRWQLTRAHGLKRPPHIVAVVMIHIRRPGQDVFIKLGQTRGRSLIAFKAGHAVREKGFARQALERRQLALVAVQLIELIAAVEQKAQPGRGSLKHRGPYLGMAFKKA